METSTTIPKLIMLTAKQRCVLYVHNTENSGWNHQTTYPARNVKRARNNLMLKKLAYRSPKWSNGRTMYMKTNTFTTKTHIQNMTRK